jgi:hypothetical protein
MVSHDARFIMLSKRNAARFEERIKLVQNIIFTPPIGDQAVKYPSLTPGT